MILYMKRWSTIAIITVATLWILVDSLGDDFVNETIWYFSTAPHRLLYIPLIAIVGGLVAHLIDRSLPRMQQWLKLHLWRTGKPITWTTALSSLALFITIVSLALHVRLGVGHWPQPMWEDYRTTVFDVHLLAVTGVGFFTVFVSVPLWALCICIPRLRLSARTHLIQAALYVLGWSLIVGFVMLDPYQFIDWLAD